MIENKNFNDATASVNTEKLLYVFLPLAKKLEEIAKEYRTLITINPEMEKYVIPVGAEFPIEYERMLEETLDVLGCNIMRSAVKAELVNEAYRLILEKKVAFLFLCAKN